MNTMVTTKPLIRVQAESLASNCATIRPVSPWYRSMSTSWRRPSPCTPRTQYGWESSASRGSNGALSSSSNCPLPQRPWLMLSQWISQSLAWSVSSKFRRKDACFWLNTRRCLVGYSFGLVLMVRVRQHSASSRLNSDTQNRFLLNQYPQ